MEWWPQNEGHEDSPPKPQHRTQGLSRRIHILGTGNIGTLVAHSLADIPNRPPITLLIHNPEQYQSWKSGGECLRLITNGMPVERTGFDVDVLYGEKWETMSAQNPDIEPDSAQAVVDAHETISNLIVTVKAPNTVAALKSVQHRLTPASTILFLQNGMGILEEVSEKLFTDPETRPNYMLGIISHGVNRQRAFTSIHAGMGTTSLGVVQDVPPQKSQKDGSGPLTVQWAPSSRYLLRTLTRTPVLAAVGFSQTDLMQLQLEKLVMNAIVNPLTVMLDCHNGELLYNFSISRVMRLLIAEISAVIRMLPELQGVPNARMRFAPDRLETLVVGVASKTAKNTSSMLQDVRRGSETEIDYINGYIVKRGEEKGLKCALNYMMVHLVQGKQRQKQRELKGMLPIELSR